MRVLGMGGGSGVPFVGGPRCVRAAPGVAGRVWAVALGVLAALARVRLAPDAVHGDGQGLVRLLRGGAEGYGPRREALHDLLGRLDLLQGDGVAPEVEQPAQGTEGLAPRAQD